MTHFDRPYDFVPTTTLSLHDPDDPDDMSGMGRGGIRGSPTLASGPPRSMLERTGTFVASGGGLVPYLRSLSAAFGWRYVAAVIMVYGINQGVGEPLIFVSQGSEGPPNHAAAAAQRQRSPPLLMPPPATSSTNTNVDAKTTAGYSLPPPRPRKSTIWWIRCM